MNTKGALLSGIAATAAMTLFSYLVSARGSSRKNYREPELLEGLLQPYMPEREQRLALPAGWAIHGSLGILQALIFQHLWQQTGSSAKIKRGLISGTISGLTGVLIWKPAFSLHPRPPETDYQKFYVQLVLAHCIFALTASIAARTLHTDSRPQYFSSKS